MTVVHRSRTCRAAPVRLAAAAALISLIACIWSAGPAWGATAGAAHIVNPADGTPLNFGGSRTQFALSLPTRAHCPGDTTQPPWYRAYSYLVPAGTSPTAVNFKTGRPSRWFGFYSDETYFANNVDKGTGQVDNVIPGNLTFWPLPARVLVLPGASRSVWETGVACADVDGNVASYWNVEVAFSATSSDPKGYTWTVTHHVSSNARSYGFVLGAIALSALFAAGALMLVVGRRPRFLIRKHESIG